MKLKSEPTPLSQFITTTLSQLGLRQSEFCRTHQFDQGLLSKLMSGQLQVFTLETAIKLALGLNTTVTNVLTLSGQTEKLALWQKGDQVR